MESSPHILKNGAKRRLEQVRLWNESGCAGSKFIELLRLIRVAQNCSCSIWRLERVKPLESKFLEIVQSAVANVVGYSVEMHYDSKTGRMTKHSATTARVIAMAATKESTYDWVAL